MNSQRKFAVFDIDGTVIRWQLYHAIVSELAKRGHLSKEDAATIQEARMTWKKRAHTESFREYEHTLVKVYLQAVHTVQVDAFLEAVDHVFDEHKDQVYTYTRNLIQNLKAQNYLLFAISGSQQEILSKLADHYGFDEAVGTLLERQGDRFSGKEARTVVGRKAEILNELVAKHNATFAGSIAVGDSAGDIAMLELVEHPIAFNPAADLFAEAQKQSWDVVLERKNVVYKLTPEDGGYSLGSTGA